jgi:uncharacterized protein (TIGR02001 family)
MNMKTIALAAIGLGAISLNAENTAAAAKGTNLSLSASIGYESKYVFRGVQYADEIYSPSFDASFGNFYAGAWFALAGDKADPYPTEADVYAGYNFALSPIVTLDVGATRFAYNRVMSDFFRSGTDGNSLEFFTGASANILLSPSAYVYYDIDNRILTFEAKIGHSFAVGDHASLNLGASTGWVIGTSGDDFANSAVEDVTSDEDYVYAGLTADLVYTINEKSSVSIGARYSIADFDGVYGSHHDIRADNDALWFGAALSTGF